MNDAPTGFRDQLRQAAYARLMAIEKLQNSLAEAQTPLQKKMIIEEIFEQGQRSIQQMGASKDAYLVTHTHLNLAFAMLDMVGLVDTEREKDNLLRECVENCDLAAASASESEYSLLALDILPEVFALLTQVMDHTQGSLLKSVQLTFTRMVDAYTKAVEKQKLDRSQAAKDLYAAQLLYLGEAEVQKLDEHTILTAKIIEMAQSVRRKALGASDRDLAAQADTLIREIENQP